MSDLKRSAEEVMILAYLMFDGPEPWYAPIADALIPADIALIAISITWLLVARFTRRKGEAMRLPKLFWYFAGPAAGGALIIVAGVVFALATR